LTSSNMPNLLVYGEKCPLCDIHFFSSLFCFCFCLCLHLNWIILSTFFLPVRISFNRFVSYLICWVYTLVYFLSTVTLSSS
jgi:hypothetical protein